MPNWTPPAYYVMEAENDNGMLLYSLANPAFRDSWLLGRRMNKRPTEPVEVGIINGHEKAELMHWFDTPPVMSNAFHQALVDAGVDNMDAYDAVLKSEDGKIEYRGFKAVNIIGLIKAADMEKTVFSPDNPSRLIDASIESLAIDPAAARDLLFFRLAEFSGAVIVHEKIKRVIERHGFPHVVFREPSNFIS